MSYDPLTLYCILCGVLFYRFIFKYQGIPEQAEAPPVARVPVSGQAANSPSQPTQPTQPTPAPASGPNANPLDLFPQVVALCLVNQLCKIVHNIVLL